MSEEKRGALYKLVRGFPLPTWEFLNEKNIEDAMDGAPEDGDLVLASYPKTGTNWVQYILLQIRSNGESFPSFNESLFNVVPYVDMTGFAPVLHQQKPRFYRHHLPYNLVQKNDKSKVVYTYRNPEDTAVSYYHFLRSVQPHIQLDFNQFFDGFVTGEIGYGSYFRHVLSFYQHRNDDNLLMVSYEKLHANRKEEILKVAKFLDEDLYGSLLEDQELLENIIRRTSFDYMKKNLRVFCPVVDARTTEAQPKEEGPTVNLFRKGIVGDGKALLTDEQRQLLKETAERVLKGTTILDEWYCN